ncbi:hypothetical protein PVAND_003566 [Polypedilum vanderplanki]|uniref:Uncharacterized protein n=1 Tax=Polypedilum vanderplanki TaxID=319348 RepID=A0A9J6BVI2_POLVA|nr:hypothetical protein PVAND_003566 [Polypedilum vanderplanki]
MEGRGWNDTPQVLSQNPTGKLKINLNKRVAFPLQKGTETISTTTPSLISSLPPSSSSLPPMIPTQNNICDIKDAKNIEEKTFNATVEIDRIFKIFNECLPFINQPSVQSNIKAKLKNLEEEWNSCDKELQKLIVELAEHVDKKNVKEASAVQRKIVMQGYNKQFMHAIRQIILNIEAQDVSQKEVDDAI